MPTEAGNVDVTSPKGGKGERVGSEEMETGCVRVTGNALGDSTLPDRAGMSQGVEGPWTWGRRGPRL